MGRIASIIYYVASPLFYRYVNLKSKLKKSTEISEDTYVPNYTSPLPSVSFTSQANTDNALAPGWTKLSPFINAWTKVFIPEGKYNKQTWILIWNDETSAMYRDKAVPRSSLIYKYITSTDEDGVLQCCENILFDAYLQAREFIGTDKNVQPGLEIAKDEGNIMACRHLFGIEVSHKKIDDLLMAISKFDTEKILKIKAYLKGGFVHEMTHELRKEYDEEENTGQEIASHAVEILSCGGDNPLGDENLLELIKNKTKSYNKDVLSALTVVKEKLSGCKECCYAPMSFRPAELNKAMKSIPEDKRESTLKEIAGEIIKTTPIELLRFAAGVKTTG